MRFDEWQDSNGSAVAFGTGGKFTAPGTILQVVSTTKTDTQTTTSTSFVDVTGLSATITPTSTTSKVLVMVNLYMSNGTNGGASGFGRVLRDGTAISNRSTQPNSMSMATTDSGGTRAGRHGIFTFLDSPSSTSALTYKVQFQSENASYTVYVNRAGNTDFNGGISTITLMEVAA